MIDYVKKLSDRLQKDKRLEEVCLDFVNLYNIEPCIGVEIEFYLSDSVDFQKFTQSLNLEVKKERGKNQFEVDLAPSTDLIKYIKQINKVKTDITNAALLSNGYADFRSKPFPDDYGNSMHFHVSFLDFGFMDNKFLSTDDENFLAHAARSLCNFMLEAVLIFLPKEEDYLRFDQRFMTPANVSFGGNNRTVAIRMPDTLPKRLEHRLGAPSADLYLSMLAILRSIFLGLQYSSVIKDFPKIYGNAYDSQYNLVSLPKSYDEALKLFNPSFL